MTSEIWQRQEFKPNKPREYRLFLLWKSLPLEMRKGGSEYLESRGINDPDMHDLASIRTQKQFSHKFKVDMATLSHWNRQPVPAEYQDIDWRVWAKHLASEVLMKLWEGIEERKDPASIKLYMQLIGEYTETSKVQIDGTLDLFEGMRSLVENLNGANEPQAIEARTPTLSEIVPEKLGKRRLRPREKTVPELLKARRQEELDQIDNPIEPSSDV